MEGFTSESPKPEKIYSRSRVKPIILRETPSSTIQNGQLPIVMWFLAEKQWMNILDIYHHEVQLGCPILWIHYFFLNTPINWLQYLKFAQKLQKRQGKLDTDGSSSHRSSLPGTATIPTYNEISTNKPHYKSQTTKKNGTIPIQHNPSNFWEVSILSSSKSVDLCLPSTGVVLMLRSIRSWTKATGLAPMSCTCSYF